MIGKYPAIPLPLLATVIAQLVHFAHDDFGAPDSVILPEQCQWTVAYTVSCFIAQHTLRGEEGVDTETGWEGLKVYERMPFADRLALAEALVTEWSTP